jgi:uncharacterized RDD family membrane protein YckC
MPCQERAVKENPQIVTVETPEHVAFQFHLAGIGTRFIAYLIDKLIQTGMVLGLTIIALLLLILTDKITSLTALFVQLRDSLGWWLIAPTVAVYEIITKGYFIFFEYLWNGSTPGKRSQEIRVIRKDGRPISFVAAVIRNILRAVDILAEIYPLGLVVMFIDSRNRRLGDLAAGTLVVRERELMPSVICTPLQESNSADAEILNVALEMTMEDYDLVRKFLARRDSLDADYRRDLARQILERVSRRSVSIGEESSNPEAFLEKLETLCRHETKEI